MPGILGIFGEPDVATAALLETLDPLGRGTSRTLEACGGLLAASALPASPLAPTSHHEDPHWAGVFAGDLVGAPAVPWGAILDALDGERFEHFSAYRGTFALAVLDKTRHLLFVAGDRASQHPLFYRHRGRSFVFSTTPASFCRLAESPLFDADWLRELLYFNYPLGGTTMFEGVSRIPRASVLRFDLRSGELTSRRYAGDFARAETLLDGDAALDRSFHVLRSCLAQYFPADRQTAVSLTAGLDSRTVLSFVPPERRDSIVTYTYGVEGCGDLVGAADVAASLGLPHRPILFGPRLRAQLPGLLRETIRLSGGLERATRATLPYAFRELTADGTELPVVVTGVSGDHLFRDHVKGAGNVPALVSRDMMRVFWDGRPSIDEPFWRGAFGDRFAAFEARVRETLGRTEAEYGDLGTPEAYVRYLVYETAAHHFCGEAQIAGHFALYRTPYWDPDVIRLAFEIEFATLGFSERLPKKDPYLERVLQAYLIERSGGSAAAARHWGIPLRVYAANNPLRYRIEHFLRRGPARLGRMVRATVEPPLEDWAGWFEKDLADDVRALLGPDSLLAAHVEPSFLERMRQANDVHWLGKLLTAELVLRLIRDRWSA